jgi:hypothetical protein
MIARKVMLELKVGRIGIAFVLFLNFLFYIAVTVSSGIDDKVNFYTIISFFHLVIYLIVVGATQSKRKPKRMYSQLPMTPVQYSIAEWIVFFVFMFYYTVIITVFTSLLEGRLDFEIFLDALAKTATVSLFVVMGGIFDSFMHWKAKIWGVAYLLAIGLYFVLYDRFVAFVFMLDSGAFNYPLMLASLVGACFLGAAANVWVFNRRTHYLN